MDVKVYVDFKEVAEKLRQIGPKLARKSLRKGVSAVGDMWVPEMQARVPVDTGDLRDSIAKKVSTSKKGDSLSATVTVGPSYDTKNRKPGDTSQQPGVYGLFVEFGTKSSPAKPFMRPVFDATADKAVEILANVLKEDLADVVLDDVAHIPYDAEVTTFSDAALIANAMNAVAAFLK
jgi:HK97 gp10 family phage protein